MGGASDSIRFAPFTSSQAPPSHPSLSLLPSHHAQLHQGPPVGPGSVLEALPQEQSLALLLPPGRIRGTQGGQHKHLKGSGSGSAMKHKHAKGCSDHAGRPLVFTWQGVKDAGA